MDRAEYNACMGAGMKGKKMDRRQRSREFCVLAKLCSKKVGTREEAETICDKPKLPKWAQQALPQDDKTLTCAERISRTKSNLEAINLKVKYGEAKEAQGVAAQAMNDIFACNPDRVVIELVNEAMGEFRDLATRHYLKGEAKSLEGKINIIAEVL